jgi:hypothetical protein
MKKSKYIEGPKAKEKFEPTMTALFRIPKSELAEKIKKKAKKRQGLGGFTPPPPHPSLWCILA